MQARPPSSCTLCSGTTAPAPRGIKDELAALLRKEGKTWQEVVREYVASVKLLMQEAEELERLLDGLGERIEKRLATPPPPVS